MNRICFRRILFVAAVLMIGVVATNFLSSKPAMACAQESGSEATSAADTETDDRATTDIAPTEATKGKDEFNILWLLMQGGWLMLPIAVMSCVTIAFTFERALALRQRNVLPTELIEGLSQMSGSGKFDPRQAYRLCQSCPSSASNVIRSMLLKVGRPHSEVEHAVTEASEREADRLFANVRWLTLAAAVTPLMGLFGTVVGMIQAFYDTTQIQAGQNKADFLAEGIYVALVTTMGGLAVAIPAAIAAHFFEGRITMLFHKIDELLFNLLPQVERYEGRLRVSRQTLDGEQDIEEPPRDSGGRTPTLAPK